MIFIHSSVILHCFIFPVSIKGVIIFNILNSILTFSGEKFRLVFIWLKWIRVRTPKTAKGCRSDRFRIHSTAHLQLNLSLLFSIYWRLCCSYLLWFHQRGGGEESQSQTPTAAGGAPLCCWWGRRGAEGSHDTGARGLPLPAALPSPATHPQAQAQYLLFLLLSVLGIRIRIRRICMFLGFPDPDPLVRGMDPDL